MNSLGSSIESDDFSQQVNSFFLKYDLSLNLKFEADENSLPGFLNTLARYLPSQTWVFLDGDLGFGKTTFVKGVCSALSVVEDITSPTFSIINSIALAGTSPQGINKVLHLDLYRIKSGNELCYLGLEGEFHSRTLALFEWPSQVEREDWEDYFLLTGGLRPAKVFNLVITPSENNDSRRYELSWEESF